MLGGDGNVGNDHPMRSTVAGFEPTVQPRTEDDAAAAAILAELGFGDGYSVTLHALNTAEIPILANAIAEDAAPAGFVVAVEIHEPTNFYNEIWCPAAPAAPPCSGAADFGIVDFGHRPLPDVVLRNAFASDGPWAPSQLADPAYDGLLASYDRAATPEASAAALAEIEARLIEQLPVVIPYFIDHLWAGRSDLEGISVSPLGQPRLWSATAGSS